MQKEVGVPISYPSHQLKDLLSEQQVCDFAASFQKTAVDILCEKLEMALAEHPEVKSVVLAGGVSANEIGSGVEPTNPYALNIYPRVAIEE